MNIKLPNIKTPQAFKRTLWVAFKGEGELDDYGELVHAYKRPKPFKGTNGINYQPLSSKLDFELYGANSKDVSKAVVMKTDALYKHLNTDVVGSVVYLYDQTPFNKPNWDNGNYNREPKHGYWANYQIDAVLPMLQHKIVYFKKRKDTGV